MKVYKKKIENPYVYLKNAQDILREKAKKDGEFYTYPKYVKMAGHTAWAGVLLALDYLFKKHDVKVKGRKDVDDYRHFIAKKDRKILNYFNSAYETLHLVMGYDGELSVKISKTGLDYAKIILDWVAKQGIDFEKEEL
ncbi:MAG: DUF5618 family protein [Bacteroidia bacterium]|nr:DUF5618 family protein [Bacteroidia bacterium]